MADLSQCSDASAAQSARSLRFDVITLFPELIAPFTQAGIVRRAFDSGQVGLRLWNPRDFAEGNYRRVDDRPFGGGPGMVMMAEPLAAAFGPCAPIAVRKGASRRRSCFFRPLATRCAIKPWKVGPPAAARC